MRHKNNGFTLIEVLLALFITAILITILSVIFNTGLRAYRQGKDLIEITRKAQFILGQMTKDIACSMVQVDRIPFEIKNNGNNDSIYFMSPVAISGDLDLCELGYFLADVNEDGIPDLRRHYSNAPFEYPNAIVNYTTGNVDTFCTDVTQLNFRYRLVNNNWAEGTWSSTTQIPEMVEIKLKIQGKYGSPPQTKEFTTWVYVPNSTVNP